MSARLPLEPLRAFVHAAKLGGFRAAAEQLHLTPGAISQRIAALESHLGTPLFERDARGVRLSVDGEALFRQVAESVATLEAALQPERKAERLRLHTVASFANLWLVPRLGGFHDRHPGISVEIEAGTRLVALSARADAPDLSIRYGEGGYPGLEVEELARPDVVLVASPEGWENPAETAPAQALRSRRLLREPDLREWRDWLERFAVDETEVRWGAVLEDDAGLIGAALSGQGIASVRRHYVEQDIADGRLVCLATRPSVARAYFLAGLPERWRRPAAAAFRTWLRRELRPPV